MSTADRCEKWASSIETHFFISCKNNTLAKRLWRRTHLCEGKINPGARANVTKFIVWSMALIIPWREIYVKQKRGNFFGVWFFWKMDPQTLCVGNRMELVLAESNFLWRSDFFMNILRFQGFVFLEILTSMLISVELKIVEQRLQKEIFNCKTLKTEKTTPRTHCLRSKIKRHVMKKFSYQTGATNNVLGRVQMV